MGKYEPLSRHLSALGEDSWEASFAKIEQILGGPLPPSAYSYQAWWANQSGGGHSQTRGWADAGFETRDLDLEAQSVRFERVDRKPGKATAKLTSQRDLIALARAVTGIQDEGQLIEMALKSLLRQEASGYLASLGGIKPDAEAAPRRRFDL